MSVGLQGNINLIEAAAKKGVKKFILLTSIGVGDSKDAPPAQVYDVLKPVLIEKGKAEERLKVSIGALHMGQLLMPVHVRSICCKHCIAELHCCLLPYRYHMGTSYILAGSTYTRHTVHRMILLESHGQ